MKIGVILGSIREIRRGGRVAKWLMPQLSKFKGVEFELLDLKDYPLPFFNESNSPSPNQAGGIRAVEQLRLNSIDLQMAPIKYINPY